MRHERHHPFAAMAAVALVVTTACTPKHGFTLPAAPGRHLQDPWWNALPDPSETEPTSLVLPADALFDSGEATVRAADAARLRKFAHSLLQSLERTDGSWIVTGATDSIGDSESNLRLGLARAEAVRAVLLAEGVNARRLRAESWGEARPVADENGPDPDEARARNRRVELVPAERSP